MPDSFHSTEAEGVEVTGREALLPCPFCGKTHALTVDNLAGDDWYVECGACKVQQHAIYQTSDAAIAAWNRRTDAALIAENARLREALQGVMDALGGECFDWGPARAALAEQKEQP